MAVETERKFLVKGEFRHLTVNELRIVQAYLSVDRDKTIRIRISNDDAYITIKGRPEGQSISRSEWEFPIPPSDAAEIMKLCLAGKIVKTRYHVPVGKHTFEVDVFHDKNDGLIIAEIELSSDDERFEIPDWLGEEVTGNPNYYDSNLRK
jgi:adenylate cyclase